MRRVPGPASGRPDGAARYEGSSAVAIVDEPRRTARALRLSDRRTNRLPDAQEIGTPVQSEPVAAPRSEASLRSEKAHERLASTPRALRPLTKARDDIAAAFDRVMSEHWLRGEEAYSNVAVARACGVDERIVREWRSGEKPMPAAALALIPSQLYAEMVDSLAANRRQGVPRRALVKLRESLAELDGQLGHEDGAEVVRALAGAQGQIASLMAKAVGGAK